MVKLIFFDVTAADLKAINFLKTKYSSYEFEVICLTNEKQPEDAFDLCLVFGDATNYFDKDLSKKSHQKTVNLPQLSIAMTSELPKFRDFLDNKVPGALKRLRSEKEEHKKSFNDVFDKGDSNIIVSECVQLQNLPKIVDEYFDKLDCANKILTIKGNFSDIVVYPSSHKKALKEGEYTYPQYVALLMAKHYLKAEEVELHDA